MANKQVNAVLTQLGNPSVPLVQRSQKLADILLEHKEGEGEYAEIVEEVFARLQSSAANEIATKRAAMLKEILDQLQTAPLRTATFIQMENLFGGNASHALVVMDNGEMAHIVAHDQEELKKLNLGDRVMVDANMKIMVGSHLSGLYFGPEARLERKVDAKHIEVISNQDERNVVLADPVMIKQIESGEVTPGASVVLGAGGRIGIKALPVETKAHFRFLDRGAVPDVLVDRDIGSPPKIINQVATHVREEMTRPELRRKFRLRPCRTVLLSGVSGSGKSLAIAAVHRRIYEVMEEVTETPIAKLPHRVFRFRTSQMLSMWLGESDKNIDRLFDEAERLADEKFTNHRGKEYTLPVMVVLEEADGMGRSRGSSGEAVYDRILTTILQRLDPNRESLAKKLVVFISTTNEPNIIDPAFLRRIGGTVEQFGRIDQKGFVSILSKHVAEMPAKNGKGSSKTVWKHTIDGLSKLLFDPAIDQGVVQLTYQGQSEPVVKYRRDFLTGALIDRAVQEAATQAWEMSIAGDEEAGITFEHLLGSLKCQVDSVANQLVPQNVGSYLDLPEGVRVTSVRRIHAGK